MPPSPSPSSLSLFAVAAMLGCMLATPLLAWLVIRHIKTGLEEQPERARGETLNQERLDPP